MPGDPDGADLTLDIPGDALAVRQALQAMVAALTSRGLPPGDRGTAEIVLAEVLNNIVEHAYAGRQGLIHVTIRLDAATLECRVVDDGQPMPGDALPPGDPPPVPPEGEPAEGGFGWFLIRSLSQDLTYRRADGRNLLSFRLATSAA